MFTTLLAGCSWRCSQLCGRCGVDAVGDVVGHVEEVDLLQDVVRVVQRPSRGRQAGELLYQAAVLTQQTPHLVLYSYTGSDIGEYRIFESLNYSPAWREYP